MDEERLFRKLRAIEALFADPATTDGEKVAASRAKAKIMERLKMWEELDPPREYKFTVSDEWSRKLLYAILRRYGIQPYRYKRQRYTTVMAMVSPGFVDDTIWPQYLKFSEILDAYLEDVTDRVVGQVLEQEVGEARVVEQGSLLE